MRQYPLNRFVSGTYKRECDDCGWDYLRNELTKRWDGALVCNKCWEPEPRHVKRRPPVARTEIPIDKLYTFDADDHKPADSTIAYTHSKQNDEVLDEDGYQSGKTDEETF